MKYTLIINAAAEADLAQTFQYLHDRSPQAAERWLRQVRGTIAALADFAGYGPAREAATLGPAFRQRVVRSHRIVFTVDEADRRVTVFYVRHAAQRTVGEVVSDDPPDPEPS